jgi:hypothetical protein
MTKEVRLTGYLIEDYGAISVGTSATEFDSEGETYEIANNDTETIYMGDDSSVTVSNGYPIFPQSSVFVRGKIYLIASSPADARYVKVSK